LSVTIVKSQGDILSLLFREQVSDLERGLAGKFSSFLKLVKQSLIIELFLLENEGLNFPHSDIVDLLKGTHRGSRSQLLLQFSVESLDLVFIRVSNFGSNEVVDLLLK